eukprot:3872893-Amphidinium_carterae.2
MSHDSANSTVSDGPCACSLEYLPLVSDGLPHCALTSAPKTFDYSGKWLDISAKNLDSNANAN